LAGGVNILGSSRILVELARTTVVSELRRRRLIADLASRWTWM
jgi:hypothetical protein